VEDGEDLRLALQSNGRHLEETRLNLNALVVNPSNEMIYWIESYKERISLHAAPLHVGPLVEKHIFNVKETVVLTSATLRTATAAGNGEATFAYLRDRLHAREVSELAVGSPFDYPNCTLVYLPTDIPEPNQPGYQRYVEQAIILVAQALGGRTMALFTSYSQLLATARAIEQPLADADIVLLAQGEGSSRQQLLDRFKQEGSRAVLLGTRSFWEGVDVPGPALQAVLITKFPFDVPTDPIFAARSETFNSPFFEYSVPEAVLRFRQGFGRLIRRQSDEGVVIILDKRVMTKRYGQLFLDALPGCTVVRQRIGRVGELTLRWLNREK
jgi:ATP-dependent DNA helicase DinG